MSRRLARAGRLGQRSTGQGKLSATPYIEFDANRGVWADLARTIPAAIGEPVAAWDSVGTLGVTVSNSTANQQPRLGYADCYGNLVRSSDDLTNADEWEVLGSGTIGIPGSEPGKWGEQTIIVGPEDPEVAPPTSHSGIRQNSVVLEEGESYVFQVSARLVEEVQHTQRMRILGLPGTNAVFNLTSTEWGTYTAGPFTATGSSGSIQIRTQDSRSEEEALTYWEIGRVTLRKASWTPVHVVTTDAPIIPDESNKELAVVFDGVNDRLVSEQYIFDDPFEEITLHSVCSNELLRYTGERQGVLANDLVNNNPEGYGTQFSQELNPNADMIRKNYYLSATGSPGVTVTYPQEIPRTEVTEYTATGEGPIYGKVFELENSYTNRPFRTDRIPLGVIVGRIHPAYGTLNGGISRIILFDKVLSEAQRAEVRNHLYTTYRNTISLTDPATLTANTEVFWSVNHDLVAQTPSLTFDISGLESGDEVRGGNSEPYIIP